MTLNQWMWTIYAIVACWDLSTGKKINVFEIKAA